jgi:hypothetical protein
MQRFPGILLVFLCPALLAQRNIEKKVAVPTGQILSLEFDYPELIKVYAGTTNELIIKGKVSINRGENDEAFELKQEQNGNVIRIISGLRDKDKLPKRLVLKKGDQEYYFKTDNYNSPEVQKFLEENGNEYAYMNNGIIMNIELEVYLPKGVSTTIDAKYGMVEVLSCDAPLTVLARYGGVDVTVPTKGVSQLNVRTRYGEIYSNLSEKPVTNEFEKGQDNWTAVSYTLGSGHKLELESKYGKVYLRKSQ